MNAPEPRTDEPPRAGEAASPSVAASVGRVVAARVEDLFTSGGPAFRDLGISHAASTAGDTLVAIALAGTLFFSVPSSEARGNVALYLVLTVAPFAVIGPLLGRLLDRSPRATRVALVWAGWLRTVLAVVLVVQLDTVWLFPVAFGLLVLSRTHGIARNAVLPVALERPTTLVTANARLARIGVYAGALVAPVGAFAVRFGGAAAGLSIAAATFVLVGLAGRRLPDPRSPHAAEQVVRRPRLPNAVRLAQLATGAVRFLNGFLVLLLAFAFRDANAPLLDFGAVLGAAGLGFGLSSISSPYLEARLREEPMVVAALAVEAAAAFVAGQAFGLPAAAALALAAGFAWGTAKLAFDGLLQATMPSQHRGAAFTRSETVFQLAWVLGAVLPTAIPVPTGMGLAAAGIIALTAQVVYVSRLLLPTDRQPPLSR